MRAIDEPFELLVASGDAHLTPAGIALRAGALAARDLIEDNAHLKSFVVLHNSGPLLARS